MKKTPLTGMIALCTSILFLLCISGCFTPATPSSTPSSSTGEPSSLPLETQAEWIEVVRKYNIVPRAQQTEFTGAVPLETALYYFIIHNRLGEQSCSPEYQKYYIPDSGEGVLAKYKIPKSIVEKYLLRCFLAIDDSGELEYLSAEDDCYILCGSGVGVTPTYYTIREIASTDTSVTFLCDSRENSQGAIFLTQKFVFAKRENAWLIDSVTVVNENT